MAIKPDYPAVPRSHKQAPHPPGILVSDLYREPYGYKCHRPEGTKDWLVMYTLSGQGRIRNGNGGYLECVPGTVTLLSPGTPQEYFTTEDMIWEKMWAHFIPRITWIDWMPSSNTDGPVYQINITDKSTRASIESAFRRVLSYRLDPFALLRDELTLNALEEIILLLSGLQSDKKALDPRIREVLNILVEQYAEDHPIKELAHKVCLSPSRLSHLFKEQVGDSIIETLMKYRLRQAEKLLQYTFRPITEIALDVGFHSSDYFSRQFASYYGVTPSHFRKQHREQS
ncbi:helix-turn-helix domain-containing protein [Paenibacillus massiliensis]|uniref:helix-turn-helix domain-containing protein n=1 Tax=Paenibacillus massiliensis TaxID=225917 RepID=UPI00048D1630|nr:helix-turn-helix domain-containing protein [Paenibacillus massiliensis]